MSSNEEITRKEMDLIRSLDDFDLMMLVSEIHDHGWPMARRTLVLIREFLALQKKRPGKKRPGKERST